MEEQLKQRQFEVEEEEESEVGLLQRRSRHVGSSSEVPPPRPDAANGSSDSGKAEADNVGRNEAPNRDHHAEGINGCSSDTDFKSSEGNGFRNSVYFDKLQAIESKDSASEVQSDILNGLSTENNQNEQDGDNAKPFVLSSSPVKETHENHETNFKHLGNESEVDPDVDSVEEIDEDSIDYDVEKVIEKQNTHDLYCPNCNSCITRRVILRRKRKITNVRHKRKRTGKPGQLKGQQLNEIPTGAVDNQSFGLSNVDSNRVPTPAPDGNCFGLFEVFKDKRKEAKQSVSANVDVDDGSADVDSSQRLVRTTSRAAADSGPEPEVFRCLSCFSLFIPTGNCFRIFPFFRSGKHEEANQSPQEVPAIKAPAPGTSEVDKIDSPCPPEAMQSHLNTDQPGKADDQMTSLESGKPTEDVTHHRDTGSFQNMGQENNAITESENSEMEIVSSPKEGSIRNKGEAKVDNYIDTAGNLNATGTNFPAENAHATSEPSAQLANQPVSDDEIRNHAAAHKSESGQKLEESLPKETSVGPNVAVDGGLVEVDSSQIPVRTASWAATEVRIQVDANEARDTSSDEWEILKSIVYGGLLESIASLGVVSSAAGAGAATLNILALGLANLVSGFFVLLHNLIELKRNYSEGDSTQTNVQGNRYQQLLGRRDNFRLHATIAILSYIIFGLVPPAVYGFSFRKSNDKEYKLIAVASASLMCIFLLALGKGHVARPHRTYIKSVSSYLSMGVGASGLSYVVGVLLQRLLTKLGLFESSAVDNLQVFQTRPSELPWAAY